VAVHTAEEVVVEVIRPVAAAHSVAVLLQVAVLAETHTVVAVLQVVVPTAVAEGLQAAVQEAIHTVAAVQAETHTAAVHLLAVAVPVVVDYQEPALWPPSPRPRLPNTCSFDSTTSK
jgi:hypothetical protein